MIGKTVAHYRIIEKIGSGGMGVVYKAEDTKLKRMVALKFLPPELTKDTGAKQRFLHEARAAAALNHANIITVYEINEYEGQTCIAMEYIEGQTLKEIVHGPLPLPQALDIAQQTARGLAAAHAKGIIHRDIKPANIFITKENVVKILDFGIAKLAGGETKLTKTGTTMGTAAYMSPEQTSGKEVDQRTDIWSLGVILYEMLSGKTPFQGEYMQAVVYSILNEEPNPLGNTRSDIPPGLDLVVAKALAKNPKNRYQNINDLAANLKAAVEGTQPIKIRAKGFGTNIFSKKTLYLSAAAAALAVLLSLNIGGIRSQLFGPKALSSIKVQSTEKIMLAVLPMENLSGDPQQEYFSDGMTEEMIAQLGRLQPQRLGVIARTSVMHYKNTTKTINEIGRELGVQYMLEGSVRREANRVRITTQLIQVRDQTHLWAESYERDLTAVFTVQAEVAERVAQSLAIELLPEQKAVLARGGTVNPEAHEAYLKGLFLWSRGGRTNLEQAVALFQRSVALDPAFAPAYIGLADAYTAMYGDGWIPREAALPGAEAAIRRALDLDDTSAEAHATYGSINTFFHWNWLAAEKEFRRALDLDPGSAKAHYFYCKFLIFMGRTDEAIAQARAFERLDPTSPRASAFIGSTLIYARRYEEAARKFEEADRLFPNLGFIRIGIAVVLESRGQYAAAAAAYSRGADLYTGGYHLVYRAHALALEGREQETRKLIADVESEKGEYISPAEIAFVLMALNDSAGAMTQLERAVETHDGFVLYILNRPTLAPLSPLPRFQALLRRMGIPAGKEK